MNKNISALVQLLNQAKMDVENIEGTLQEAYDEVFNDNHSLNDALNVLERSNDYRLNSFGEIESFLQFDSSEFDDCKKYLKNYLRDYHYVEIDFNTHTLSYSLGPSIVISDEGDIYDQESDAVIARHVEYKDLDGTYDMNKRNQLIEKYMEDKGYYPGVFRTDYYGNVYAVDTKEYV